MSSSSLVPQFGVGTEPTMSSREIAELVGSTHDSVLKTVRALIAKGVVSANETPYTHPQNGQSYPQFLLSYRDTMVVVSGYSVELRARIIDRWQELEAAATVAPALSNFAIPQTYAEALRLAADQSEQIETQKAQIATLTPKASAYDAFINADGLFGYQNAGRALGCRPRMFTEWLKDKFCFYQGGVLLPRSQYVSAGYFEIKGELGTDEVTRPRGWVTPRGLDYLAKHIPPEIRTRQTTPAPSAQRHPLTA